LSLATPAAIVVACNQTELVESDDALDGGGDTASQSDVTSPPKGAWADDTLVDPPPLGWEGGIWNGQYWDAGNYAPDASLRRGCGGASLLEAGAPVSTTRRQFPCGEQPEDAELTAAECSKYCASQDEGRPLRACRGARELDGGAPVLDCDYKPSDPKAACGCAQLLGGTILGTSSPADVYLQYPCGELSPDAATTQPIGDSGYMTEPLFPEEVCAKYCAYGDAGEYHAKCGPSEDPEGIPILLRKGFGVIAGRRPEGLAEVAPATGTIMGAWLAEASRMEAASVDAFVMLREELVRYGAPSALVERARLVEADEARHARMTAKLARCYGADEGAWSCHPEVEHPTERSLEAIALENAVEGCVSETYAALLAMWQAERAREKPVRDAMRAIAEDETPHAALAWSVAEWIAPKLDEAARAHVDAALEEAVARLAKSVQSTPDRELLGVGILPAPEEGARLVDALSSMFWADRGAASPS